MTFQHMHHAMANKALMQAKYTEGLADKAASCAERIANSSSQARSITRIASSPSSSLTTTAKWLFVTSPPDRLGLRLRAEF
jgi:hypothetical protein